MVHLILLHEGLDVAYDLDREDGEDGLPDLLPDDIGLIGGNVQMQQVVQPELVDLLQREAVEAAFPEQVKLNKWFRRDSRLQDDVCDDVNVRVLDVILQDGLCEIVLVCVEVDINLPVEARLRHRVVQALAVHDGKDVGEANGLRPRLELVEQREGRALLGAQLRAQARTE